MAKELPYFQFEPAEYLTKDISFCSLSAQGLFINICSYYWQRQCQLSKEQFLRRFNYPNEFEELLNEGVIDVENDKIIVKFLDIQFLKATEFSKEQARKGSLGGRPKKPNESRNKAEIKPNESQTKAIREDKIIIDKYLLSKIKISDDAKFLIYKDENLDYPKENIIYVKIAKVFQQTFIENLKEKGSPIKTQENATFKNYVDPIRLMLENKECTIDDLRDVESYLSSQRGEFWKSNILCTSTLRKKIQHLVMEARKPIVQSKPKEKL